MIRPLLLVLLSAQLLSAATPYAESIEAWRKNREQGLKAPEGWLAVAGLYWLKEGENRAGSDPTYEIALPEGRAPKRIGVFDFHGGKTTFHVASGANVTLNGKKIITAELRPDVDKLQTSDFTMFVIQRGGKYALRMRDINSKMRRGFKGLQWYPVEDSYRVTAKFTSYPQPQKIPIPNVLGVAEMLPTPGYATFELRGQTYRLDPVLEEDQLFFIFRDLTAAKTTYGAGRFLYADLPKDGKVVLDFNKAHNPPCAFTPFATCPLPPKQNRLQVKIEAGELKYDH